MPIIKSFTIFDPKSFGNGAEKRCAQIKEILEQHGNRWQKLPEGIDEINYSRLYLIRFLKVLYLNLLVIKILSVFPSLKRVLKNTWLYSHFLGILDIGTSKANKVILFEISKIEFFHVILFLKKKKYKVIGMPHNLESLVPSQKSGITNKQSPKWFTEEIKMLSTCEHVFTISMEENLLLRSFHINADYLPYYPPIETTKFLMEIREQRIRTYKNDPEEKKILMLGSYMNSPTKQGINNRIDFFNNTEYSGFKLIIAGFGTEKVLNQYKIEKANIEVLGQVDQTELRQLLLTVDSILIHQNPSSGALTRIPESLIAGVPVIANVNSSRNYFKSNGLYTYNSDKEMLEYILMRKDMPLLPERPQNEYDQFLSKVAELNEA